MPAQRQTSAEIRAIEIPAHFHTLGEGIEVIAYIRLNGFTVRPTEPKQWEVFEPIKLLSRYADQFQIAWLVEEDPTRTCATAIEKIPARKCWGFVELVRGPTNIGIGTRVIVALFQRLNRFNVEEAQNLQVILKKIRDQAHLMAYIELPHGDYENQHPCYRYIPPEQGEVQTEPQVQETPITPQPLTDQMPPPASESHDQSQGEDDMRESAITKANATVYATNQALIEAIQAICPNANSGTLSSNFFQAANGDGHLPAHWRALVHEANRRGCPNDNGRVTKCNWNFDALMKVDPVTPVMPLEEAIGIVQGGNPRPRTPPAPPPHVEPQEERAIVNATAADLVFDGLVEELNGDPAMKHALVEFVTARLVPMLRTAKQALPVAPSKKTYTSILDDVLEKAIPPDEP